MASHVEGYFLGFQRTANLPAWDAMTVAFRACIRGAGGSGDELLMLIGDSGSSTLVQFAKNDDYFYLYHDGSGDFDQDISDTIDLNVWYDIFITLDSSQVTAYWAPRGAALSSFNVNNQSFTPTSIGWGEVAGLGAVYAINADFDDLRVYNATLTQAQIEVERARRRPSRFDLVNSWAPFPGTTATDFGPNKYTFSAVGSPTAVDGAPVPWGGPLFFVPYAAAAAAAPTLSAPGVNSITATSAIPKVTLTF